MTKFDGLEEGLGALRYVFNSFGLLLRVATTWSIIVAGYSWFMIHWFAYSSGLTRSLTGTVDTRKIDTAFWFIFVWMPHYLLWLLAASAVAVVFHRAVLENYRPKLPFAPVNRRSLRYLGKLIFAFIIANSMAHSILAKDSSGAPLLTDNVSAQVESFVAWLMLAVFSVGGLALTAVAINDRTMGWKESLHSTIRVGIPYVGGFLLAVLPLWVASSSLGRLTELFPVDMQGSAALLDNILATFFACASVASVATYLSRAYLALSPTFVSFP